MANLSGSLRELTCLKNPEEEQIAILMTRNPITITSDKSIVDAARLILDNNVRRLPVVEDGHLIGLVTIADIVGAMGRLNITTPISDYISDHVVSVWSETPLSVVARSWSCRCESCSNT